MEFQKDFLCIEPDTLTEKLMELCAPFYSHYDQTYYGSCDRFFLRHQRYRKRS